MTLSDIELPEAQDAFVRNQLATGQYANVSDLVCAALEQMQLAEHMRPMTEDELDDALEASMRSGIAEGDVFARVRERTGLSPRR